MENKRVTSRVATMEDVSSLSELVNSAYRGDSSKKGWTTEADLIGGQRTDSEILKKTIETTGNQILVFFNDSTLLGCVLLQKRHPSLYPHPHVYLGMLTVKPDLQGSGLGKTILSTAENWVVQNWNYDSIEMTVLQQRVELIAWYERRGFRNTGRKEPFPYGDEKFGIPKVKDLEFVVLEKKLKSN